MAGWGTTQSLLLPILYELKRGDYHPGIGPEDEFDICFDNMHDRLLGKYYNKTLKMSETATLFEGWEMKADRGFYRYFRGRMLALVDNPLLEKINVRMAA